MEKNLSRMPFQLEIDHAKCVRCGSCVRDCVASALNVGEGSFPAEAPGGRDRCIGCQHCMTVCPTGALSIFRLDPEASQSSGNYPPPSSLLALMRMRRSFRRYRRENVDRRSLNSLLEMLKFVPSGVNDHRLHYFVIDDTAQMDAFRDKTYRMLGAKFEANAPEAAPFAAMRCAIESGKDPIFRGAPHLIVVSTPVDAPCSAVDPVIALSYFELLAQDMGMGSCWCGYLYNVVKRVLPELAAELKIPAGYEIGYAMLFGNPQVEYLRAPQPPPVTILRSSSQAAEPEK